MFSLPEIAHIKLHEGSEVAFWVRKVTYKKRKQHCKWHKRLAFNTQKHQKMNLTKFINEIKSQKVYSQIQQLNYGLIKQKLSQTHSYKIT